MRRRMDAVLALKNSISANRVGALPGSRRDHMRPPALDSLSGSAHRVLASQAFLGKVGPGGQLGQGCGKESAREALEDFQERQLGVHGEWW